ncbi:hypothetical protein AAFC00_001809 [Neodothiora populina]|uniref:Uncharacterized protein n=1 Tax=Neodothiora populina TaxID=2781224 RepID=A0ABR3PQL8_9PEZI
MSAPSSSLVAKAEEQQQLLKQLNQVVDRLRTHISDEPYITTIPQDEPRYHHYSRFSADAWLTDTPFDRNENYQLQYQTFFYREPYSDLYERVRYSHFNPNHNTYNPTPTPISTPIPNATATSTPALGPKKKISLAAYKDKQARGPLSRPTPVSNNQEPATTLPSSHQHRLPQKPESVQDKKPAMSTNHDGAMSGVREPKRKQHSPAPPSPPKRQRLSPPRDSLRSAPPLRKQTSPVQSTSRHADRTKQASALPVGRLSPLDSLYLPGRLSPTLPPEVEAALDREQHKRADSGPSGQTVARTYNVAPTRSSRQDSNHSPPRADMNDSPTTVNSNGHRQHNRSLLLVLKIPKRHRASFRRLVQFSGRASKDRKPEPSRQPQPSPPASNAEQGKVKREPSSREDESEVDPAKGLARKVGNAPKPPPDRLQPPTSTPKSANKRPRDPDDSLSQPDTKRKKIPPALRLEKDQKTPLPPEFRSPALLDGAARSQQATPTNRKDLRTSLAMKRVESSDSLHRISTPSGGLDRTPASTTGTIGPGSQNHSSLRPPSSSSAKTPEAHAWQAEYTRLSQLAKELKHAAPDSTSGPQASARSTQRAEIGALSSMESFLAFVLAFFCNDKAYAARSPPQLSDVQNWISCHGFWRQVKARCQPYPHLSALTCYLGAVYNGIIMRRLTNPQARPDPKNLHDSTLAAFKAVDEALAKLPLSVLESDYPKTWQRALTSSAKDADPPVKPGHYKGRFSVNIGIHTPPLEAVRFAYSLMAEWSAKEGLAYDMKMKLTA